MLSPIDVMISGIPGNMAVKVARAVSADTRFTLVPLSLTGPDIDAETHPIGGIEIRLFTPEKRDELRDDPQFSKVALCIDYTHPMAVAENAAFYCENNLPFVLGTTGGDADQIKKAVATSQIPAVVAPNMAKQIVGFQAMMAFGAENFPNLFKGYTLTIRESHQKGKADTSGTAKAMVAYFNRLGLNFSTEDIHQERDPQVQKKQWGIPEAHLSGHAWHTYELKSADQSVCFSFSHNVNGRDVYMQGTLDAAAFLADKIGKGEKGVVYSMIDVLKNH